MGYWDYVELVACCVLLILSCLGVIALIGVLCWVLWPPLIFIFAGIGIFILAVAYILYQGARKKKREREALK